MFAPVWPPVDSGNKPDLSPLVGASRSVGKALKKGDIVVYESTVYPGATEEDCIPVLERESGLKFGVDFTVGYSPERINPGDREHTFTKIKKIVSGSDARTLEARLEERRAELERGLARVAGAGEHGVRISETRAESGGQPPGERPNTGRAYLEWLQARARSEEERARRGRALAGVLAASLEGLIRAERVDPLPEDQGLVSVSHLVARAHEAEYGVGVERFRASRPDLNVLRTGPWPPYSFGP